MSKPLKIYGVLLIIVLILAGVTSKRAPRKVDWTPSFNSKHKSPWGTYVLFNELKGIVPKNTIRIINKTPYEKLNKHYDYNIKSNYFFVNNRLDQLDSKSIDELLDYVSFGNNVFFNSRVFPKKLLDALKFDVKIKFHAQANQDDTNEIALYFANTTLNPKKYFYEKEVNQTYFSKLDSINTTILGYNAIDGDTKINFVKIKYGEGYFFVNTQPYAFTNYHLLKVNHADYVATVLSYIEEGTDILWDSKIKARKSVINDDLAFIFKNPELAWAWRLSFLGVFIFIIFNAKRRQRIIPIIKPKKNTTIAFAKTIGEMYYKEGEVGDIIEKRIHYFLAFIRKRYYLDTSKIDKQFIKKLHLKSGVAKQEVANLFAYIYTLNKYDKEELIALNKKIEQFYKKIKQ